MFPGTTPVINLAQSRGRVTSDSNHLHQLGEELQQLRGYHDGLVGDDPGDGLLAAGLGQAPLVLDELRVGGDEGGEGHRLQAGPGA